MLQDIAILRSDSRAVISPVMSAVQATCNELLGLMPDARALEGSLGVW